MISTADTTAVVVLLVELSVNFRFISDKVDLLAAHCVLCAFQRRPSFDLHCFPYNFPKQVTFIKVRAGMKDCEMPPLQLLQVHILQKIVQSVCLFCSNMKVHTL